jgi:hypothetical protein
MRPIAIKQTELRTPLNQILGRESHVRMLRVLSEVAEPLLPSQLAPRAGLDLSGLRRSLGNLLATGIVARVDRKGRVGIVATHPLAKLISSLFKEERKPFERCLEELCAAANSVPEWAPVWIEGSFALDRHRFGEPIEVGTLPVGSTHDSVRSALRYALDQFEDSTKLRAVLHVRTRGELASLSQTALRELRQAIPLWGAPPHIFAVSARRRAEYLARQGKGLPRKGEGAQRKGEGSRRKGEESRRIGTVESKGPFLAFGLCSG